MKGLLTLRAMVAAGLVTLAASNASAQVFGTFTWQMQPYCNKVTLTLTSLTANFILDGTEDQCGATNRASAVGVATFNTVGNVTLNFTIVTAPSGKPVHVSAVVSPADGSGTWTDSVGNSGTFAFFGNVPGLLARPLPPSGIAPAVITNVEIANDAITGAKVANGSLASVDLLDSPRAAFAGGLQELTLTAEPLVCTQRLAGGSSRRDSRHTRERTRDRGLGGRRPCAVLADDGDVRLQLPHRLWGQRGHYGHQTVVSGCPDPRLYRDGGGDVHRQPHLPQPGRHDGDAGLLPHRHVFSRSVIVGHSGRARTEAAEVSA